MTEITRDSIWRTQDGTRVAIKDMGDDHLLRLIRCFRGMSPIGTKVYPSSGERKMRWVNALANEAYARGLELDPLMEGEPVHE